MHCPHTLMSELLSKKIYDIEELKFLQKVLETQVEYPGRLGEKHER